MGRNKYKSNKRLRMDRKMNKIGMGMNHRYQQRFLR